MSRDQMIFDEMFRDQVYGPRDGFKERPWQSECTMAHRDSLRKRDPAAVGPHVFCIYAGTGSGKTKTAALIASSMMNDGVVDQVVIVCPNRSIIRKTRRDFARYFGIDLVLFNGKSHANGIPRMQQGYILTYAGVMSDPTLHRRICQQAKTLVIFDEIHHLGDEGSAWGDKAVEAFGKVGYILALTGTPWRSDNTRIPFVRYEETETNGMLKFKADFPYSLGEAVADGVCRKPLFQFHGGKVKVRFGPNSGYVVTGFDDTDVSERLAQDRLRGAVKHTSTDRTALLSDSLSRCRAENRKVIIFLGGDTEGDHTPTNDATSTLPQELQSLGYSQEDYEIVVGDDGTAQQKIEQFGAHEKKWILISINMVSEGTDIPEISAAIFLTSITAQQTTVQRIGRALRLMGEDDPHTDALIFMFSDKNLTDLAKGIDDEIEQEVNLKREKREASGGSGKRQASSRSEAIGIGDGKRLMIVFHGREWPVDVFEEAKNEVESSGLPPTMLNAVLHLIRREKVECAP